jgi:[ribosomal protein S5]-alanine N-acetyltransferase
MPTTPVLKAENVILRSWQSDDLPSLVLHANNVKVWNNLRDYFPNPYTDKDGLNWIKKAKAKKGIIHWAIEINGEAAGCISLNCKDDVYKHSAEMGYWLGEKFWNKGFMTKAVQLVVQFAFLELKLARIFSPVFEFNLASASVLEKSGFHLEARLKKAVFKNEQLIDELLYVRLNPKLPR